MSVDQKFGELVEGMRTRKGWSMRETAKIARIPLTTLHSIENGTTAVRLAWVEKLGKVFGEKWLPWQRN
jgi:predicted transcriptional regulator